MRRIAIYSHDTLGLGHLRRCLKLAAHLRVHFGSLHGLLLTGSPWHRLFRLPEGFRVAMLPPVVKSSDGSYASRAVGVELEDVLRARRERISADVETFRPDLFVVDNVPCGLRGEVLPALREMRRRGTRTVLALRDVLDDLGAIRYEWERAGALEAVARLFDEIWIFGDAGDTATLTSHGPLAGVTEKVHSCGRIDHRTARHPARDAAPGRPEATSDRDPFGRRSRPLVLVTGGGGRDASPLMRTYLEAVHAFRPVVDSHLVLGPDFLPDERRALPSAPESGVTVSDFDPELPERMARSEVIVGMAGYNTVCEILASGRPAVLVPRVTPRQEQLLRARRWTDSGRTRMLEPSELTPRALWEAVDELLERPPAPRPELAGGHVAARRAIELLEHRSAATERIAS